MAETKEQQTNALATIKPAEGAVKTKLRVGRGRASGAGKTANRGHNGEGQRSGQSRKRGFEGGQMPGYRRQPKFRRFEMPNRRNWLEINIGDLEFLLEENETALTYELLTEYGFIKRGVDGVRLLGNGELTRAITVEAHYASPSAKEKLAAAGGKVILIGSEEEAAS
jgi:large subunit ribosomal protein L15